MIDNLAKDLVRGIHICKLTCDSTCVFFGRWFVRLHGNESKNGNKKMTTSGYSWVGLNGSLVVLVWKSFSPIHNVLLAWPMTPQFLMENKLYTHARTLKGVKELMSLSSILRVRTRDQPASSMTYKNLQNLYLKTLLKRQQKIPNKEGPPQSLVKKKNRSHFQKKKKNKLLPLFYPSPAIATSKNKIDSKIDWRLCICAVFTKSKQRARKIKLFFEFIQKRRNERANSKQSPSGGRKRERSKNPRGQPHSSTSLRSLSHTHTLRCRYSLRA